MITNKIQGIWTDFQEVGLLKALIKFQVNRVSILLFFLIS